MNETEFYHISCDFKSDHKFSSLFIDLISPTISCAKILTKTNQMHFIPSNKHKVFSFHVSLHSIHPTTTNIWTDTEKNKYQWNATSLY